MVKTTAIILNELTEYASPADKLHRLVIEGDYIPIVKGLYETDRQTPGYLLAECIYGPSYLSFEFALAYHGLIPEAVYTFTSATFDKRKKKSYQNAFGNFTYRDVPVKVYPYGVRILSENNRSYKIATPEKALCDQLYKTKIVSNYGELEALLYEDLRIDILRLRELDTNDIAFLADNYGSTNVKILSKYMRRFRNE